jgi:hypothetical protein
MAETKGEKVGGVSMAQPVAESHGIEVVRSQAQTAAA